MGRGDALDDWIVTTAPQAVAYAASLLRDRSAAEDVVQDCYCRLLEKSDVYDLPRDGRKLLFASVTNACVNRNSREPVLLSLHRGDEDAAWDIADRSAQSPERVLMHRELEQAIAAALARLPPNQRAALELKSLGHSLHDIAEMLNLSANHAGVLVHRARQALAQSLAPYLEEKVG